MRTPSLPVLIVLLVLVAASSFTAATVLATEPLKYPFLPAKYSEPYIPTLGEWKALELGAYGQMRGALTGRLTTDAWYVTLSNHSLILAVQTDTQASWPMHQGQGHFSCSDRELRATYEAAAQEIVSEVQSFFPDIPTNRLGIIFYIRSHKVADWLGSTDELKLAGDE